MRYLLLFFFPLGLGGQSLAVLSTAPAAHTIDYTEPFVAELNAPIDPATLTSENFQVFGRWTGVMPGTLELGLTGQSIRFHPAKPFISGDLVFVKITKNLKSLAGDSLAQGYAWQFLVPTAPGTLQQPAADTIFLRLPGEGLIQTYGAYAGDLDGDGFSDLTVVNETSDDLRIMLNDGTGHYGSFEVQDMGSSTPSPSEGADFDHDGDIDLAVSTAHDNELRVLYGDGAGHFSPPTLYPTGAGARGVVVLDCNADGWDDIFVTNRLASNITLLINENGAFPTLLTLTTPATGETACAGADIDENGVPDVFVASFTDGQLLTMLGNGDCSFTIGDQISLPGQPWMIAAGDLNADGHADAVSANSSGNNFSVVFGDGSGQLSAPTNYTHVSMKFPIAIDLGDVDGDGDLDVVTSNYVSVNYSVYANDGAGNFSLAATLPALQNASCAILHDRDNDGDLDITGTDETADVVILFENTLDVRAEHPLEFVRVSPNPVQAGEAIALTGFTWAGRTATLTDALGRRWAAPDFRVPPQVAPGLYRLEIWDGMQLVAAKMLAVYR